MYSLYGSHGLPCTITSDFPLTSVSSRRYSCDAMCPSSDCCTQSTERACSPLSQQDVLVVAEDVARATLAEHSHDLVREAKLVHGVAGAEQFVDVAHAVERDTQSLVIAVDVGDDADLHRSQYRQWTPAAREELSTDLALDLRERHRPGRCAGEREPVRDALHGRVRRRRDAVHPPEQRDLAVEEVRLY